MKIKFNLIVFICSLVSLFSSLNLSAQSTDTNYRKVQVSFVPYIGTNGYMTNRVSCDLSFNILAGYVKEVRSFEIGGLFNMVRENAGKCQLAGLGNMVGGTSSGVQCAGIINLSKRLEGIQIAGNFNFAGSASGMQISGLVNQASRGNCSQISGLVNNAGEASIFQIAGLLNNSPIVENFQIAGLVNNTRDSTKVQLAGLVNNSKSNTRVQIAGLINNSSASEVQISGLVNRTSFLKGVQIGFLNISDSCRGIPIGILSLVKNGYHKIEIYGDEMFYTNLAFRSGVKKFHNILMAGMRSDNFDTPLWTYGFGAGTSFLLNEKTSFDLDLLFQTVIKGGYEENNNLYKITFGLDHKLGANFSIAFAATYNFLVTDAQDINYGEKYSSIAPYHFSNHTFHNGFNLKSWAGLKLGLRFL